MGHLLEDRGLRRGEVVTTRYHLIPKGQGMAGRAGKAALNSFQESVPMAELNGTRLQRSPSAR